MSAVLGLLLALAPAPTPLSPPHPPSEIELTWQAPEGCPRGEEVVTRYRELLHVNPTGEGVMVAEAVIREETPGVWRLDLVTRMGEFTDVRKLRAERCAELGEAAAMLFAVALEPTLDDDETTAEPKPAPEPGPEPEPEPAPPEDVEPEPKTESNVVETPAATAPQPELDNAPPKTSPVFLSITGGLEAGALPGVTARVSIGSGYAWHWARAEGDVFWFSPRSRPGSFGDAVIQVAGATARGCGTPGTGRWKFPVCLGFEAGATVARVGRRDGRRTIAGRWLAPLLRAAALYQGQRIGTLVAIEGAGPVFGTQIRVDDDTVFDPTRGSIRGILGLEIYFF